MKIGRIIVTASLVAALLSPKFTAFAFERASGEIKPEFLAKGITQDIASKSDLNPINRRDTGYTHTDWRIVDQFSQTHPKRAYTFGNQRLRLEQQRIEFMPNADGEYVIPVTYNDYVLEERNDVPLSLEKGDIVTVNGRGSADSFGSTHFGKEWTNHAMVIVAVREGRDFPYACAIISDDPKFQDIMAWFTAEELELIIKPGMMKTFDALRTNYECGGFTLSAPMGGMLSGETVYFPIPDTSLRLTLTNDEMTTSFGVR